MPVEQKTPMVSTSFTGIFSQAWSGRGAGLKEAADDQRIKFILFVLAIGLVWNFAFSLVPWGWPSAAAILAIDYALYLAFTIRYRDLVIARLLVFGLVAGAAELLADEWLVDVTRTLVYVPEGPFILRSPLYMPFAWASVLLGIGYIGYWLSLRLPLAVASILTATLGAVNIPLYEEWAKGANWWYYRDATMFGNAPLYIIAGEFLIALALPLTLRLVVKTRPSWALAISLLYGLWIWAAIVIAYAIFGQHILL